MKKAVLPKVIVFRLRFDGGMLPLVICLVSEVAKLFSLYIMHTMQLLIERVNLG